MSVRRPALFGFRPDDRKTPAVLDYPSLQTEFGSLAGPYAAAAPFPHVVLHDLIPREVLRSVAKEFPDGAAMGMQFADEVQVKAAESRWEQFGPATRAVIAELNSGSFIQCLTRLTGIDDLIVDANLVGAGQHQIQRGGMLKVHADFDRHVRTGLLRRLNVLVYLNELWEDDWGGHLELWDRDMTEAVVRVAPRLGTMVVFSTTDQSFHGHPDPLTCPPDRSRKSIALYYYTSPIEVHARRTTDFRARPGEHLDYELSAPSRRERLKRWVPPALLELRDTRSRGS